MSAASAAEGGPKAFQLVVAATKQFGIGRNGSLPWKLPGDMAYFKQITTKTVDPSKQNAVIMGRKTWESIPPKFRPLKNRLNIVLTRQQLDENSSRSANGSNRSTSESNVVKCSSLSSAMSLLTGTEHKDCLENIFVIGGGQVYREAIEAPECAVIHLTVVESDFDCDTFFPEIDPKRFALWSAAAPQSDNDMRYHFLCYTARNIDGPPQLPTGIASQHEEQQYLDLVADIIKTGAKRGDRTGTGTLSKFGCQMKFNLRHSFPLLTTKRVFWRGVAEELLWFISGSTSAQVLQDKNIHIWDGNGSRDYLDSIGLTDREVGDLGPVYGFQWRHFGAEYKGMHADYTGQGVDQLAQVIDKIRHNPEDRRIVLTAWNPAALPEMALPPCHMFCQFYIAEGELSCQMYQRSCDLGLGVPFNIASYSLLTCLIAKVCGLQPGDFIHTMGDAHVYANHVEPLKEQLQNSLRPFPVLHITSNKLDIDDYTMGDLQIAGYNPHKKIVMKMAV
ncbi:hypothetical protein ABBQ32_000413 [Trebouxia sp. C0010 RCD-2024]